MLVREEMFRKLRPQASLFSVIRWQLYFILELFQDIFYEFFYKLRLVFLGVHCTLPMI